MDKVLVLICLLNQSHDDCAASPVDRVVLTECGGMHNCYIRAMDVATRLVDDKSYPIIKFGNDVEDLPRSGNN